MRLTKWQSLFVGLAGLAFVAGMLYHRHLPLAQQPGDERVTNTVAVTETNRTLVTVTGTVKAEFEK